MGRDDRLFYKEKRMHNAKKRNYFYSVGRQELLRFLFLLFLTTFGYDVPNNFL